MSRDYCPGDAVRRGMLPADFVGGDYVRGDYARVGDGVVVRGPLPGGLYPGDYVIDSVSNSSMCGLFGVANKKCK